MRVLLLIIALATISASAIETECADEFSFRKRILSASLEAFSTIPQSPTALFIFVGAEFMTELTERPFDEVLDEVASWEATIEDIGSFTQSANAAHSQFKIPAFHRSGGFENHQVRDLEDDAFIQTVDAAIHSPANVADLTFLVVQRQSSTHEIYRAWRHFEIGPVIERLKSTNAKLERQKDWTSVSHALAREELNKLRDFCRTDKRFLELAIAYQRSFAEGPFAIKSAFDEMRDYLVAQMADNQSAYLESYLGQIWLYPPAVHHMLRNQSN